MCGDDLARSRACIVTYARLKEAIETNHPPTAEHSIRVRICAAELGEAYQLSSNDMLVLTVAAEIHDIGKLKVDQRILDKSGRLTPLERQLIELHPAYGMDIASQSFPQIPEIAECILMHHERMDGSGYPQGLEGSQIPMLVRILSVADAFVALTEDRSFRPAYSEEEAFHIMAQEDKGRYDDSVVMTLHSIQSES
jgi:HD-GYP domain-containing protein (c-di-GMP phosphodiesterase class II)